MDHLTTRVSRLKLRFAGTKLENRRVLILWIHWIAYTGANVSSLFPDYVICLETMYGIHRPLSSAEYLGPYYESSQTLGGPGKRLINSNLGRWTRNSISLVVKAQGARSLGWSTVLLSPA